MKPSKKSRDITSFLVMDILELAQEMEAKGEKIVHFEVGQPEFNTPRIICDAGVRAIRQGKTKYTHSLGTMELRREICKQYKKEYGVTVRPERVLVANGSAAALFLALASIIDRGDRVLMGNPYYACYPNYVSFLGGRPVSVPLRERDGFQLSPEAVRKKITKKTKAIILNSPSNPTGAVLEPERMREIAGLGPVVVSDEIYHGLTYGARAHSALEFTENAYVVSGFSKRFAMTGWRVGYVIGPEEAVRPMQKMQQNFHISACSISQEAALAALRNGKTDAKKMLAKFAHRRKTMIDGLRKIGLTVAYEPQGAFYVMTPCGFMDRNSNRLAVKILKETGVAITPGVDFGSGGEGYLRFSYTTSSAKIREGLQKLGPFVAKHRRQKNLR